MEVGEAVELKIEQSGALRNRVVASRAPWSNFTADQPTRSLVKEGQ
ncbi:MAG: hypothetical protein ACLQDV_11935 [Candidatus Binataceae bacterium]